MDRNTNYLKDVWDCNDISELSTTEALLILENAHDKSDPTFPNGYPQDQALWNEFAALYGLPNYDKIVYNEFAKMSEDRFRLMRRLTLAFLSREDKFYSIKAIRAYVLENWAGTFKPPSEYELLQHIECDAIETQRGDDGQPVFGLV